MAWVIYALLSTVFAALVAILAKIGMRGVDSNLAVALRTVIIVLFAWSIVLVQGTAPQLFRISKYSYLFIILSAIATGLSWLFYFKALQLGEVSKVATIDKMNVVLTILLAFLILGEKPSLGNVLGGGLVITGVLIAILMK